VAFDLEVRKSIVDAMRRLYLRGLNSSLSGNVSARSSYRDHFWITPKSIDKASLSIEDLSLVSIESGSRIMGGEPSSEYRMHLQIYKARSDVNAVVHTHQVYTMIAFKAGLLRRDLLEDSFEAKAYLGDIGYVPRIEPGSWELAEAAARELSSRSVIIIDGHGVACVGSSVVEALNRAEILEMEAIRLVNLAIIGAIDT
jgi:L-fuculose-phosphate aldolase